MLYRRSVITWFTDLLKTPEERVAAVEYLRRQHNGGTAKLQRVAHVIKRSQS